MSENSESSSQDNEADSVVVEYNDFVRVTYLSIVFPAVSCIYLCDGHFLDFSGLRRTVAFPLDVRAQEVRANERSV